MIDFYGPEHGNKVARKHLGWYMDDLPVTPDQRRALQTQKDPNVALSMIDDLPDHIGEIG